MSKDVANLGGRPTNLDDKVIEKAESYVENYNSLYGDVVPTIAGLSCVINRARSSVYKWIDENADPRFSDICDRLQSIQEKTLVNGGLSSEFSAPITKMLLTKHGYSDKQEVDLSSKDGSMSPKSFNDFYEDSGES